MSATLPFPIGEARTIEELLKKIQQYFDELYQERIGGALVGDVFGVGDDEILTLAIGLGLQKLSSTLSVKINAADAITSTASGLGISDATTLKHGALPILSNDATQFLDGKGLWTIPGLGSVSAGSSIVLDAPTERSSSSTSYTTMKSAKIVRSGTYRITFSIKSDGVGNVMLGKVFKDDAAWGGPHQPAPGGSYQTFTEDLAFLVGEEIEIKIQLFTGATCYVKDFTMGVDPGYVSDIVD